MTGFALIARYWREGIIALLALTIGALLLLNAAKDRKLDNVRNALATEQAKHAVTLASLDTVTGKLREVTAAVNRLAEADAERIASSRAALARAEAANKARQGTIDALRASAARQQPSAPCEPSEALKEAWE